MTTGTKLTGTSGESESGRRLKHRLALGSGATGFDKPKVCIRVCALFASVSIMLAGDSNNTGSCYAKFAHLETENDKKDLSATQVWSCYTQQNVCKILNIKK